MRDKSISNHKRPKGEEVAFTSPMAYHLEGMQDYVHLWDKDTVKITLAQGDPITVPKQFAESIKVLIDQMKEGFDSLSLAIYHPGVVGLLLTALLRPTAKFDEFDKNEFVNLNLLSDTVNAVEAISLPSDPRLFHLRLFLDDCMRTAVGKAELSDKEALHHFKTCVRLCLDNAALDLLTDHLAPKTTKVATKTTKVATKTTKVATKVAIKYVEGYGSSLLKKSLGLV